MYEGLQYPKYYCYSGWSSIIFSRKAARKMLKGLWEQVILVGLTGKGQCIIISILNNILHVNLIDYHMKSLIFILCLCCSFNFAFAQEIMDSHHSTIGYISNGEVMDSHHSTIGYISGSEIMDSHHSTIGYISNGEAMDSHHSTIGYISGDELMDSHHFTVGYLSGSEVMDSHHSTVGYTSGVSREQAIIWFYYFHFL